MFEKSTSVAECNGLKKQIEQNTSVTEKRLLNDIYGTNTAPVTTCAKKDG